MISPLAKWSGWDLMGLMGMWDLGKVLTLEMLMVSAFSVDGSSHHFRIQNVPVLWEDLDLSPGLNRDLLMDRQSTPCP